MGIQDGNTALVRPQSFRPSSWPHLHRIFNICV